MKNYPALKELNSEIKEGITLYICTIVSLCLEKSKFPILISDIGQFSAIQLKHCCF